MALTINPERLLERFLQYVRIDTTARPGADSYPSSDGQRQLGQLLAEQLRTMGAQDVVHDENGLVKATIPGTVGDNVATIAFIAHLDTSPESPGANVNPRVLRYTGGEIRLEKADQVISPDEAPELRELGGRTLVVTDGATLLGGDDKAGVAIIMEVASVLLENPALEHGPVRLLFTCDEEIGRGTDKIDLAALDAAVGYTLDGGGEGVIDVETFSADGAKITLTGRNIHPSIAKGRMVSAVKAAASLVQRIAKEFPAPETTEHREGFVHPYEFSGSVGKAVVKAILRSFDAEDLQHFAERLRSLAADTEEEYPGLRCQVEVTRQYRNLAEGLRNQPLAVGLAEQAFQNLGREFRREIVRGGTDGSMLTEKGLPTPNLSSGQHNIHSPLEFVVLEEMVAAVEHAVELARLWGSHGRT